MPLAIRTDTAAARRFAPWAIGPWVLLLLAGLGCAQYLQHAEYAYLLAAMLVIVVSAGCILRQAWARSTMQALAVLLAAWALVSGMLMLQQWGDFGIARQHARAQPQLGPIALWMIARAQRTWQIGLALKALGMPLLLWLAWQLGRPAVRAQFRRRRWARSDGRWLGNPGGMDSRRVDSAFSRGWRDSSYRWLALFPENPADASLLFACRPPFPFRRIAAAGAGSGQHLPCQQQL